MTTDWTKGCWQLKKTLIIGNKYLYSSHSVVNPLTDSVVIRSIIYLIIISYIIVYIHILFLI